MSVSTSIYPLSHPENAEAERTTNVLVSTFEPKTIDYTRAANLSMWVGLDQGFSLSAGQQKLFESQTIFFVFVLTSFFGSTNYQTKSTEIKIML